MRELERKSVILTAKSEEDLIRQGREEAARDLASLKVRTHCYFKRESASLFVGMYCVWCFIMLYINMY